MPTETLPAEDMAKASERLNGILGSKDPAPDKMLDGKLAALAEASQHNRKPRSDKGRTRPEKPKPAPAGVLTKEQRRELESRVSGMTRTRQAMENAIGEYDRAQKYYEDYLEALTAK